MNSPLVPPDSFDADLRERAKSQRLDLGLALLSTVALPGVRYTLEEIAAWCGCHKNAIWEIERKALMKIRRELKPFTR